MDGPGGLKFYWHDLKKYTGKFLTRQTGGELVMVWSAMLFYGVLN